MKQLETTIAKLMRDPLHAVTVIDLEVGRKIVVDATGSYLSQNYGSAKEFFEKLHQDGILNFEVQDRRKNGTSYKLISKYVIESENKNPAPAMKKEVHNPEVIAAPNFFGGLMGGLNMMDVAHKTMDYGRLTAELASYKEKCERLEKENKKLEIENLKHELGENKSALKAETLNSYAPMIQAILPMLLGKGGSSPAPSLGMPAENITDLKHQFIEMVKLSEDVMIEYLIQIAGGMASNSDFDNELAELMTKHNLLQ